MPEPPSQASAQRFSLRRVNRCLGLLAVVRTNEGRARCTDGRHWPIQLLANAPRGLWSADGPDEEDRPLVGDYLDWLAPCLLPIDQPLQFWIGRLP